MTLALLFAAPLLSGAAAPVPGGGGAPSFHLVARAKVDRLQVDATWESVRVLQPTGTARRSAGKLVVPFREVSPEMLTVEVAALDRLVTDLLDPVPGTPAVSLPDDARILMHWDRASGELEFLPAFRHPWAKAAPPGDVAFTRIVEDWPEGGPDTPGWDGPPRSKSFTLTKWQPGSRRNGRIPAGVGFARVDHTGRTVFAPTRELAMGLPDGPDAPTWWLSLAEDDQGNRWLWFEQE